MDNIKVLINGSDWDWAWPQAVRQVFRGRPVELLLTRQANEALNVLQQRRVHTAIIDMDSKSLSGLGMIRVIRSSFPLLPCILVAEDVEKKLLSDALELNVFSVISKPVDMELLASQLNRLFIKRYNSSLFD
jgi:DNA-binding NtrC family response regulator